MTRRKAFVRNLIAFAAAAAAFTGYALWLNPGPLFLANSALTPFLLTLGLTFVVGPVLMLLLFRPGKKGLLVDVLLVILLQTATWAGGAWLLWKDRPAWLVLAVDRIVLIRTGEVNAAAIPDPSLRHPAPGHPILVATHVPDDPERARAILFEAVSGGADIDRRPSLYEPPGARDAQALRQRDRRHPALPDSAAKELRNRENLALLPLVGPKNDLLVALDVSQWRIADWWNLDPWQRRPAGGEPVQ